MAKIPQFGNLQLNGAKNGVPSNLISAGSGLRKMGEGLNSLANLILQKKREDDQLQYQKALLDLDEYGSDQLNNPDTGYKNLQGENALEKAGEYNQNYSNKVNEIRETLKGNSFLDKFDLQMQAMTTSHARQLMIHESQQQSALALQTMKSGIDLAVTNAESLYNDPTSLLMGFNNLMARVDEYSAEQGMPAELRQAQKENLGQQYFSAPLDGWIANTELTNGNFSTLKSEMEKSVPFKQLSEINQAKYLLKLDSLIKRQNNGNKDSLSLDLSNAWAMQTRGIEAPEIPLERFTTVYGDKGKQAYDAYQDQQIMARNIGAMQGMPTKDIIGFTSESVDKNQKPKGMIESGNIDLKNRPIVQNDDGTISTVRTISINEDGMEILIPTVSEQGTILSDNDAVDLYHSTGNHFGKFKTEKEATAYAKQLHNDQASMYSDDLTANTNDDNFANRLKLQSVRAQAATNLIKSRMKDPIAAAYQAGEVSELDFSTESLSARVAQATRISQDYQTPLRIFSNDEATKVSALVNNAGATQQTELLQKFASVTNGNDRAYTSMLNDIGMENPAFAAAGIILSNPSGSTAISKNRLILSDDTVNAQTAANFILKGAEALKVNGSIKGVSLPTKANEEFDRIAGNLFIDDPQARQTIFSTAMAYYTGKSISQGTYSNTHELDIDLLTESINTVAGNTSSKFNVRMPWGMDEATFKNQITFKYEQLAKENGWKSSTEYDNYNYDPNDPHGITRMGIEDRFELIPSTHSSGLPDGKYFLRAGNEFLRDNKGNPVVIDVLSSVKSTSEIPE